MIVFTVIAAVSLVLYALFAVSSAVLWFIRRGKFPVRTRPRALLLLYLPMSVLVLGAISIQLLLDGSVNAVLFEPWATFLFQSLFTFTFNFYLLRVLRLHLAVKRKKTQANARKPWDLDLNSRLMKRNEPRTPKAGFLTARTGELTPMSRLRAMSVSSTAEEIISTAREERAKSAPNKLFLIIERHPVLVFLIVLLVESGTLLGTIYGLVPAAGLDLSRALLSSEKASLRWMNIALFILYLLLSVLCGYALSKMKETAFVKREMKVTFTSFLLASVAFVILNFLYEDGADSGVLLLFHVAFWIALFVTSIMPLSQTMRWWRRWKDSQRRRRLEAVEEKQLSTGFNLKKFNTRFEHKNRAAERERKRSVSENSALGSALGLAKPALDFVKSSGPLSKLLEGSSELLDLFSNFLVEQLESHYLHFILDIRSYVSAEMQRMALQASGADTFSQVLFALYASRNLYETYLVKDAPAYIHLDDVAMRKNVLSAFDTLIESNWQPPSEPLHSLDTECAMIDRMHIQLRIKNATPQFTLIHSDYFKVSVAKIWPAYEFVYHLLEVDSVPRFLSSDSYLATVEHNAENDMELSAEYAAISKVLSNAHHSYDQLPPELRISKANYRSSGAARSPRGAGAHSQQRSPRGSRLAVKQQHRMSRSWRSPPSSPRGGRMERSYSLGGDDSNWRAVAAGTASIGEAAVDGGPWISLTRPQGSSKRSSARSSRYSSRRQSRVSSVDERVSTRSRGSGHRSLEPSSHRSLEPSSSVTKKSRAGSTPRSMEQSSSAKSLGASSKVRNSLEPRVPSRKISDASSAGSARLSADFSKSLLPALAETEEETADALLIEEVH